MNLNHDQHSLYLSGQVEQGGILDADSLKLLLRQTGSVNPCYLLARLLNSHNTVLAMDRIEMEGHCLTVSGLTALVNGHWINTDSLHLQVDTSGIIGIRARAKPATNPTERISIDLPAVDIQLIADSNNNEYDMPLVSILSDNGRLIIDPYFLPPLYSIHACHRSRQIFDQLMNHLTEMVDIPRICLRDPNMNWSTFLRFVYESLSGSSQTKICEQEYFKTAWQQDNPGHCVKHLIRCLDVWKGLPLYIPSQADTLGQWKRRQWIWPGICASPQAQIPIAFNNGRKHALFMRLTSDIPDNVKITVEIHQNGRDQIAVLSPGDSYVQKDLLSDKNVTLRCRQQESKHVLLAYYTLN